MRRFNYLVLGAGRQGTAIAYDLAVHGEAKRVVLADGIAPVAKNAAARVAAIAVGTPEVEGIACDVGEPAEVARLLPGFDVVVSAVPYRFNVALARAAVEARCSFTDLGGNTAIVKQELALDALARERGVAVVPDLGLAPGMGNVLAAWALAELDLPREVHIRCGGLPQHPRGPLNYKLVFSVLGLSNEYAGMAMALRDGQRVEIPTLTEPEELDVPGLGTLEAWVTSGGTSTCPETFEGKLATYDYKTLRYPGHFGVFAAAKTLGLLDEEPIDVGGTKVVPRAMLHALIERLCTYDDEDLVVLRVWASGKKGGKDATVTLQILDRQDAATGFTAMERTTGFPTSIVAIMMARGEIAPGARPCELAVPGGAFLAGLEVRGLAPRILWS
ncbi:MAG: saccharopine dehydrogenase C-terminal domain-containing protein [Acidobacteriota bacterium]